MKLVTFAHRGETHLGALISTEYVLDLNRADPRLPTDMGEFLRAGKTAKSWASRAIASADNRFMLAREEVALLAPLSHPGKLICIGHNYRGHTGAKVPEYPDIFAKFNNVIIGPDQPIVHPRLDIQLDYEGELAVVIGKPTRYVSEERALQAVAGYTIFNDVTARDYQKRCSQWTLGKSFDTFGPMGPALVTADEIPDPSHLEIMTLVNGEERQHSNTCDLIFTIPFLISYISQAITLEPGDLISTGTPSGTGAMHEPPVFLKPGDVVAVRVDRVGELANPIVAEKS